MAGIFIEVPDELAARARDRGLMTPEVFEQALRDRLAATDEVVDLSQSDDDGRYMEGYELGVRWVSEAGFSEIWELAQWRNEAWRHFSLDLGHSLPALICAAEGTVLPREGPFWVERTPFTEGIVEAAAELWQAASR